MTLPTDFASYATGFDLTAAQYSGGSGGTFANLVAGGENWTAQGTPTFATKGAREGVVFANSATESILGEMRCMREFTVVAILTTTVGASTTYAMGGTDPAANGWAIAINNRTVSAYTPSAGSGFTATGFGSDVPVVFAGSWSSENRTSYAQWNNNAIKSTGGFTGQAIPQPFYWNAGIGRMRSNYFTGWISRVLLFDRALHFREPALLASLITTEMASL